MKSPWTYESRFASRANTVFVERLARCDDRVARALDELLERPVVEGDADDRAVEEPARLEAVQRAERHDPREVAGDPEDHEHVGRPRPAVRLPVHGSEHFSFPMECTATSGK